MQQPDPFSLLPERNFGAGGEARRLADITRAYSDETVVWQEAVYDEARVIAERIGAKKIVDLGVGGGQKLARKFDGFDAELLQVDWADNRERTDLNLPRFFRANLEDGPDLDRLFLELSSDKTTLIILSDVIEHLDDPRLLLRTLRAALKVHTGNRLVISTPDRERVDGLRSNSIPDNPTHIRQWTIVEFSSMLESSGFRVDSIKLGPDNKSDKSLRTIIAEVSCDADFYAEFLRKNNLPPSSDHLVITTEHSNALSTGGIGTYYQMAEEHSGKKRIFLYCGGGGLPEEWARFAETSRWLHCSAICGRSNDSLQQIADVNHHEVLSATLWTVFIYDDIKLIEYQDYRGIGIHVAQAKRARMLPSSVFVLAYAHGNHLYLDHAAGTISQERELAVDARERLSIELADCAVFPSAFLRDLYLNVGGFQPRRHVLQPYPIKITDSDLVETDFGKVTTIVFYGKHTEQKGYFDFCDAVVELFKNPSYRATAKQIKRIVVLGSTEPDSRLSEIPGVVVECGFYPRNRVVELLANLASEALVVLPYKGDNHPLSIFEVVDTQCQLLAYKAGGIPEQIPAELHDLLLSEPNTEALAAAMDRCIALPFWERCDLIRRTKASIRWHYDNHGQSYSRLIESFKQYQPTPDVTGGGEVSLIVPNFNGTAALLDDAIVGIRNSFRKPRVAIFVDDASTEDNFALLKKHGEHIEGIATEVIRNDKNLGLAGTRNVGLSRVTTPYVCAHDNDNILLNRFLDIATRVLDENPEVAAVTSWTVAFNDGDQWQAGSTTTLNYRYRPIGADVGLGLKDNTFGDAMAVYRVDAVREIGGWDQTSKALWEDWQLFLKLATHGKQIWVIPKEMILYRVRPTSMLRSYPKFNGWLRIANAVPGIPPNQKYGLARAITTPDWKFVTERLSLQWQVKNLSLETGKLSHEIERLTKQWSADVAHFSSEITQCRQEIDRLLPAEIAAQEIPALHREIERLSQIERSTTWRATRRLREFAGKHRIIAAVLRRFTRDGADITGK
ncbi:glycosyltransferase [Caballeronia cordobensis]|uniref:glycosyltransferase n=1 Tax=Caballeronia cordobensis TaxID=1353886 RepID=UPI001357498A|nr:glycosyltransferase [Caballeronia cordobensis]